MSRDIDRVIEAVKARLPGVEADQLEPTDDGEGSPPATDDGLWFFRIAGTEKEIAVESATGACPFAIEHDDMRTSEEAETAGTVEEAVGKIVAYLSTARPA